jgi:hypothetical protein
MHGKKKGYILGQKPKANTSSNHSNKEPYKRPKPNGLTSIKRPTTHQRRTTRRMEFSGHIKGLTGYKKPNPHHVNKWAMLNQTKGLICWVQQQQPTSFQLIFTKTQHKHHNIQCSGYKSDFMLTLARPKHKMICQ